MAAIALAKIGKIFSLPTIITSSYETGPNGPILKELLDRHPKAPVICRPGQISAWDNEDFVAAVKAISVLASSSSRSFTIIVAIQKR